MLSLTPYHIGRNLSNIHRPPRKNFRHMKKGIQDFHSKYVFVPTDKASNNVISVYDYIMLTF